jgi:hypothetical protein
MCEAARMINPTREAQYMHLAMAREMLGDLPAAEAALAAALSVNPAVTEARQVRRPPLLAAYRSDRVLIGRGGSGSRVCVANYKYKYTAHSRVGAPSRSEGFSLRLLGGWRPEHKQQPITSGAGLELAVV